MPKSYKFPTFLDEVMQVSITKLKEFVYSIYVCTIILTFLTACSDDSSENLGKSYIEELSFYSIDSEFGEEVKQKNHTTKNYYYEGQLIKTEHLDEGDELSRVLIYLEGNIVFNEFVEDGRAVRNIHYDYSNGNLIEKDERRTNGLGLALFYKWKFEYDDSNRVTYEVGYLGNGAEDYSRKYSYDENGYLVKEVIYGNTGYDESDSKKALHFTDLISSYDLGEHSISSDEKFFEWKYEYDSNGNRIAEIGYRPPSEKPKPSYVIEEKQSSNAMDYKISYQYDDNQLVQEIGVFEYGNLWYKYTYVYEDDNRRVFRKLEKDKHYKKNYYYNDSLKVNRIEKFDSEGKLIHRKDFEYNSRGNIILEREYGSDPSESIKSVEYDFVYGESDKWIKEFRTEKLDFKESGRKSLNKYVTERIIKKAVYRDRKEMKIIQNKWRANSYFRNENLTEF